MEQKLLNLKKEYELGLNYIENSINSKDLKPLYIKRLKEIKEELRYLQEQKKAQYEVETVIKRGM